MKRNQFIKKRYQINEKRNRAKEEFKNIFTLLNHTINNKKSIKHFNFFVLTNNKKLTFNN